MIDKELHQNEQYDIISGKSKNKKGWII